MNSNNQNPDQYQERPGQENQNEIPEKKESENENLEYPHAPEQEQQGDGSDASYSEHNDVTPPNQKEFPSVGNASTDFTPSSHGRTTGRMVGHEPGTEGI